MLLFGYNHFESNIGMVDGMVTLGRAYWMAFVRVLKILVRQLGTIPQLGSVISDVRVSANLDVQVSLLLPFDCYPFSPLAFLQLLDFVQLLRTRVLGVRRTGLGESYVPTSIFYRLFRYYIGDMDLGFQNHSNEISKEAPLNVPTNQIPVGPDDRSKINYFN